MLRSAPRNVEAAMQHRLGFLAASVEPRRGLIRAERSPMRLTFPALLSLFLFACGGPLKYEVASSAKAPGADAKVVADVKNDQNQTLLEVEVKNLPPPERVADGSSAFVAWYRKGSSAQWARLASLKYDKDDRKGSLKASAPETSFDLQISAEKAPDVASPSSDIVFSQRVN